jgi:BTB/POZ domain
MEVIKYDSVSRVRVTQVDFKWTIENFSSCHSLHQVQQRFPTFRSDAFGTMDSPYKWQLGIQKTYCYVFQLIPLFKINGGMKVSARIYFLASDGKWYSYMTCEEKNVISETPMDFTPEIVINDLQPQGLLRNDTLTLLCQVKVTELVYSTAARKKNGLEKLFCNTLYSDLTFVAGGKEFPAHKALVADRCPIFDYLFKDPMKKLQMNRIEVPEGAAVFEELLRFMYTGKSENLPSLAEDLLVAAEKYQLTQLKADCEQELIKQLNGTNATRLLLLANLHGAVQLRAGIMKLNQPS